MLSSIKVVRSTDPKSDSVQFDVVGLNELSGKFDVSWVKEGYRMPEFGLIIHGSVGVLKS